ncbi:ABC-type transport system involved in Fe-S cluster assembly, permease protein I [Haloferax elongans ATCC BAA-1513]|uniref:ABC-type transport system involved in Fe-S cluster assembly, permease protein I n=1 Tax=Haloferax elongans ATCC BAA-1513 TaxID=1230453 RepID=M0HEH7_HALEO|nr:Fe-S cluster assembly protein SufB [Haloferax elongans]ELZ82936.1 ABC-type transport system involved in Fe-S cluster assembly, permease protein I [Haloferax elongans ATCC BAA-1513]
MSTRGEKHFEDTDVQTRFDFKKEQKSAFEAEKGLTAETVRVISEDKGEPEWMLERRLRALEQFQKMPMPSGWPGQPDLSEVDVNAIIPYIRPDVETRGGVRDWRDLPDDIKDTFDKLGIPEAEKNALSGVGAQYESEIVYQNMREQWEEKGVIFMDMDKAVREHPDIVEEYFMTKCVPPSDNKFAALHGAIWSGGSFVYVPEGVTVDMPVQAYFRMNSAGMGQFEHTLIVAEKGSEVHYIEGCSAPKYAVFNLHSGCVEVFVGEDAHVQYSTVQNWSKNTYNLNTKRALVDKGGRMEWISGSMGSKVTMLYPATILKGRGASDNHITIAFASEGQNIDTGAKVYHNAPETKSTIVSKSISRKGGRTNYRGLVRIAQGATNSSCSVECDALMFDNDSLSDTMPHIEINENRVDVAHEATVGKIGDEDVFYLQSRGLDDDEAKQLIVSGFIEPITKELPIEYAVELNRLVELEMEGSLG